MTQEKRHRRHENLWHRTIKTPRIWKHMTQTLHPCPLPSPHPRHEHAWYKSKNTPGMKMTLDNLDTPGMGHRTIKTPFDWKRIIQDSKPLDMKMHDTGKLAKGRSWWPRGSANSFWLCDLRPCDQYSYLGLNIIRLAALLINARPNKWRHLPIHLFMFQEHCIFSEFYFWEHYTIVAVRLGIFRPLKWNTF